MRTARLTVCLTATVVCLLAGAAAGCSGSPAASTTGGPRGAAPGSTATNPCALVTVAELAAIVNTVDQPPTPVVLTQTVDTNEFQGHTCHWEYPRKEVVTDKATIIVTAWHGRQYYTPDAVSGFAAVPGIGDAAHVQASMFMFRKGDEVFLVTISGDSHSAALRPEIAKLIASKL